MQEWKKHYNRKWGPHFPATATRTHTRAHSPDKPQCHFQAILYTQTYTITGLITQWYGKGFFIKCSLIFPPKFIKFHSKTGWICTELSSVRMRTISLEFVLLHTVHIKSDVYDTKHRRVRKEKGKCEQNVEKYTETLHTHTVLVSIPFRQ